jgi:hypothetical protein
VSDLKNKLKVGDFVHVRIKQEILKGEILAINPSRAKILFDNDKIFYVPYKLILTSVI